MSSITTQSSPHWLVEPTREWCWERCWGAVGRFIRQILKNRDVLVAFLKLYIAIFSNLIFPVWVASSKGLHMFYPKSFEPGNVHTAAQG